MILELLKIFEVIQEFEKRELMLFLLHLRFSLKYVIFKSYFTYLRKIKSICMTFNCLEISKHFLN